MVIDTSAFLAILLGEPEAEEFSRLIAADPKRLVAAMRSRARRPTWWSAKAISVS